MRVFVAGLVAILMTPMFSAAQDMVGSGNWNATLDEANCVVSRAYLDGDDEKSVFIRALPDGGTLYISVRERGRVNFTSYAPVDVRFGAHRLEASGYRYEMPDSRDRVTRFVIPANANWLAEADRIGLDFAGTDYSFEMDYAAGVASVLGDCVSEMRAAMLPEGGSPPAGHLGNLLSSGDYPEGSLFRGTGAIYEAILTVAADGTVERCDTLLFVGDAWIPRQTCIIWIERARFTPATDAAGNPIRSYHATPQLIWEVRGKTDLSELEALSDKLRQQRDAARAGMDLTDLSKPPRD